MSRPASSKLLATWGNGDFGRLGHGLGCVSEQVPRVVAALRDKRVAQVACGGAHTAVVTETGEVFTMGLNDYGQLGHTPEALHVPVPLQVDLPDEAVGVAAGHFHTLALMRNGALWAWGRSSHGCLGLGKQASRGAVPQPSLVKALQGVRITSIAAGMEHSLAASDGGELFSWGSSASGRLGHGSGGLLRWLTRDESIPRVVEALQGVKVASVAAGDSFSGAVDDDGFVHTWGNGRFWQLGLGKSVAEAATPQQVPGLHNVSHLALGGLYGMAVQGNGALMAWGSNEAGVLGMGREAQRSLRSPTRVPRLLCEQVSCGWKHAAALTGHGALYSWGWGGSAGDSYSFAGAPGSTGGQLGMENEFDYWSPTLVERLQVDETDVRHWRGDEGDDRAADTAGDASADEDDFSDLPLSAGLGHWRFAQVSAGFNHTAAVVEIPE